MIKSRKKCMEYGKKGGKKEIYGGNGKKGKKNTWTRMRYSFSLDLPDL